METKFKTLNDLEVTDTLCKRYSELLSQLKGRQCDITKEQIEDVQERMVSELLLFMFVEGEIAGTAQLSFICTPLQYVGYINGVVIDEKYRGQGLGTILMKALEKEAKERWVHLGKFMLTSAPAKGARGFYERLGYHVRSLEHGDETNIFVKDI